MSFWSWAADFVERHWADLNGMVLMCAGSVLVLHAHGDKEVFGLGSSLLLAGATLLRPKDSRPPPM